MLIQNSSLLALFNCIEGFKIFFFLRGEEGDKMNISKQLSWRDLSYSEK